MKPNKTENGIVTAEQEINNIHKEAVNECLTLWNWIAEKYPIEWLKYVQEFSREVKVNKEFIPLSRFENLDKCKSCQITHNKKTFVITRID